MTKICYVPKPFIPEHLTMIGRVNAIIEENGSLRMTLRQIYYQLVTKNWIENKQTEYSRLGGIVSAGRLAGMIDWNAIEDRVRGVRGVQFVESVADAMKNVRAEYSLDLWWNQPMRPFFLLEKDAMSGVVGQMCSKLRVDMLVTRGYNSQSEQWRLGQRMRGYVMKGQTPIVFHFGDHDPSGIDMTRDNRERIELFAGVPVTVVRLALNIDQVHRYSMPPNPVKLTDSRSPAYERKFGDTCWELDAFPPRDLQRLIEENVLKVRNEKLWSEALAEEAEDKAKLDSILEDLKRKDDGD